MLVFCTRSCIPLQVYVWVISFSKKVEETLVLCHIKVSLHQSVPGRKRDTTIEHRSERKGKGKDCVYCKLVHSVWRHTTRKCSKSEAPLCLLAGNCFPKFRHQSIREERSKWLLDKSIPKQSSKPIGQPKGSTASKGQGKRKRNNWWNVRHTLCSGFWNAFLTHCRLHFQHSLTLEWSCGVL